jgi:hypothetical protein
MPNIIIPTKAIAAKTENNTNLFLLILVIMFFIVFSPFTSYPRIPPNFDLFEISFYVCY